MSEYTGRSWECSCGWKGAESKAYDHAKGCDHEHPQVGPRYRPDRVTEGEQMRLVENEETDERGR